VNKKKGRGITPPIKAPEPLRKHLLNKSLREYSSERPIPSQRKGPRPHAQSQKIQMPAHCRKDPRGGGIDPYLKMERFAEGAFTPRKRLNPLEKRHPPVGKEGISNSATVGKEKNAFTGRTTFSSIGKPPPNFPKRQRGSPTKEKKSRNPSR